MYLNEYFNSTAFLCEQASFLVSLNQECYLLNFTLIFVLASRKL